MRKITKTTYYSDLLECEFKTEAALIDAEKDFRKEEKLRAALDENNNWVRLNCPSIKELDKYIMKWAGKCCANLNSIQINNAYFTNVSNTHNAPIGGVTNWRQEIDKPVTYPGFKFRMNFALNKRKDGFDDFPNADKIGNIVNGLHTSCGGSSNGNYEYSAYIFIQDFPLIDQRYDKALIEKDLLDWYDRQLIERESAVEKLIIKNKAESKDFIKKIEQLEILNREIKELAASIRDDANNSIPKVVKPEINRELIDEFFSSGW